MSYGLSLRVITLLGVWGCVAVAHAQQHVSVTRSVEGLGIPVPMERLANTRGGFDLGDGLNISFGIERAIYVDGNLVTYLNVSIPDIAHITTQQAMALATALSTVNVQIGPGNTFDPSSTTPASMSAAGQVPVNAQAGSSGVNAVPATQSNMATVIQNALSNPAVRSSVTPSSLSQANAATVIQNTVDNQVISSLTTLNVAVNALNAIRNQGLQQSLQASQWQALSH